MDRFRVLVLSVSTFLFLPSPSFSQIQPLVVGHSAISGPQAYLYVIKDSSIFRKYGLEVTLVAIPGGARSVQTLIAGDIQFLSTGAASIFNAAARGVDAVIVAGLVNRFDFTFVASAEIKDVRQLRGYPIAIQQFGDATDFYVQYLLRKWDLNPNKDVTLLQIGAQPARFSALQSGRVKATIIQVPNTLIARKMGFTELVNPDDLKLAWQGAVLTSTRRFLENHLDVTKRFMKALVEGIHYYKTNRQAAVKSVGRFLKLEDIKLAEEVYDFYSNELSPIPYPTEEGLQTMLRELGKKDPHLGKLKVESLVDMRVLQGLETEGFGERLYGKK